jgi:hypothetical protein
MAENSFNATEICRSGPENSGKEDKNSPPGRRKFRESRPEIPSCNLKIREERRKFAHANRKILCTQQKINPTSQRLSERPQKFGLGGQKFCRVAKMRLATLHPAGSSLRNVSERALLTQISTSSDNI